MATVRAATIEKDGEKSVAAALSPARTLSSSRVHWVLSVSTCGQGTRLKVALWHVRQALGCEACRRTLDMMHPQTSRTAIGSQPAAPLATCRSLLLN